MIEALPFAALRTFEAVVRLRGFARAAEELGVTQSAVSQQVKALEEWLGRRLIDRVPGGIRPSEDGIELAGVVLEGFGNVAEFCRDLRDSNHANLTIGLACNPGFAYLWLIPRLINFDQAFPEYQVSVVTSPRPEDFIGAEVDIAIRYGTRKSQPGLESDKLLSERIFPVCSPALLEAHPIRDVGDLAAHTRLVDQVSRERGATAPSWDYWAQETGVTLPPPVRERRFGQSNMVIQAAVQGLGVALGREPLVTDALEAGQLVRPFPQLVESQYSYWISYRRGALKSERVRVIRDWLLAETAGEKQLSEPVLKA